MILVVRRAALGDFVLTLPVITALTTLGPVQVLTERRYAPLLPPGVGWGSDDLLWRGALPAGIRIAVAFSPAVAEALRTAGVPDVRQVAPLPPPGVPAGSHYARVLDGLGLTVAPPRIAPPTRPGPDAPIVIAPGSGGRSKRWPLARWRAVAERITDPIVWVRGPDEEEEETWDVPAVSPDLRGLVALAGRAGAWLGPDAGPSHLAAAVGAPTGVVFGPTDPKVWAPTGARVFPWDADPGDIAGWATGVRLLRISDGCPPGSGGRPR